MGKNMHTTNSKYATTVDPITPCSFPPTEDGEGVDATAAIVRYVAELPLKLFCSSISSDHRTTFNNAIKMDATTRHTRTQSFHRSMSAKGR